MNSLKGLLRVGVLLIIAIGFSFPATRWVQAVSGRMHPLSIFPDQASSLLLAEDVPQATATAGCRPWSAVPNPFPAQSPNTVFRGVTAVSASDIWAVGFTVQPNDSALTLIEHWDGTSWKIIPSPNREPTGNNALFGVAALKTDDIWAVGFSSPIPGAGGLGTTGQTLVEHWDGSQWKIFNSPSPGSVGNSLNTVAIVSANNVWAAGLLKNGTNLFSTLIEHWDGTSWQVVPSPTPESFSNLTGLAAISARDIWAIGLSSSSSMPTGIPFHTLTEHWDGKTWQIVRSPNAALAVNELLGVAAVSVHDVWAVGFSSDPRPSTLGHTLIEHWNGTRWRIVASPNPGWFASSLLAVAAVSARNVWAVGAYTNNTFATGQSQTLVEHWNGQAWQVVPSQAPGILDNGLAGIVRVPGTKTLWAVGQEGNASTLQPTSEFSC